MNVHVATMNTGNFEFMAAGKSPTDAKMEIARAFTRHLVEYRSYQEKHELTPKQVREDWRADTYGAEVNADFDVEDDSTFMALLNEWYGIRVAWFSQLNSATRDGVQI
jgi:hypothetical protein